MNLLKGDEKPLNEVSGDGWAHDSFTHETKHSESPREVESAADSIYDDDDDKIVEI